MRHHRARARLQSKQDNDSTSLGSDCLCTDTVVFDSATLAFDAAQARQSDTPKKDRHAFRRALACNER